MKKRLLSVFLCLVIVISLTACNSKSKTSNQHVDGELSDIFVKIYENSGVESPLTYETVVNDANKVSMLGSSEVTFLEGLSSDAAIMTIPHSMVLIRIDSSVDVEKTKKLIKDNVDPWKWICVGVDADQVIVDNIGDLVFLVMSKDAKAYHESFLKLAK